MSVSIMCPKMELSSFPFKHASLKFVLFELVAQDENLGGVLGSPPLPLFLSDSKSVPLINYVTPSFAKV